MDLIDPILLIAEKLIALCEEVKANKKRCQRVKLRVQGMEQVLRATQQKGAPHFSPEVSAALEELKRTLGSATEVIKKYTSDRDDIIKRFMNAYDNGDEFKSLNDCLNDAYQRLSLNLQVEMDRKLFEASSQREEDEADGKEDRAENQKMLQHIASNQDTMKENQDIMKENQSIMMEKLDALALNVDMKRDGVDGKRTKYNSVQKSENIPKDIRQFSPGDVIFDFPKTPFMTTDISEVYKGVFRNFPVAIKKYRNQKGVISSEVVKVFEKEIQDMHRYESSFILRMFGIVFEDNEGLIVMEYCTFGSLRQVLDNPKRKLPWSKKTRMCLEAAQGIYRLHQSEKKSKVHGAVSSDKFMVDNGYRVKLGGLELTQTETSLRRNCKNPESSLRYRSPEQLGSVNHPYCKICEMYSLGMVLWEIATRQKPLDDCTTDIDVYKRVWVEKRVLEPLPEDCPKMLGKLINACRAFDPFQRPTAGVLVAKLCDLCPSDEDEEE